MPGNGPLFWGFKRPRQVVDTVLGSLERRMMELVWERGTLSVRAAHEELGEGFAYTTLMTTFDRLFKKGLLERRKEGRAYVYSAASTPDELQRSVAQDLVEGLLEGSTAEARPLLSTLVDAVSESDELLLDELERLVREKRRKLRREGR